MIEKKARKLGRGLSALIGEPVVVVAEATNCVAAATKPEEGRRLVEIEVGEVGPGRFQARKGFDEGTLSALADSIKRTGMMQPVVVRRNTGGAGVRWELVAGERRWRAAKMAGLARVPAVVVELTDEEAAEWGLVENVQREDLNPMDRAWAFRMLAERFFLSQDQIAERVGLERSTVANLVRLTELEREVQELVGTGKLTPGHGKALLGIADAALQVNTAKAVVGRSVRYVEGLVARYQEDLKRRKQGAPAREPEGRELSRQRMETRLSEHLGTRVRIVTRGDGTKGRIVVEFFGLDQFEGVVERMGVGEGR